ncbi:MAG: hypothetical protein Q9159_001236 [Coniocarpon cinnabarinum]
MAYDEGTCNLRSRVRELEVQLEAAKNELQDLKRSYSHPEMNESDGKNTMHNIDPARDDSNLPLQLDEYRRYGRQLILSQIGLQGQLRLKSSSILIVGAGGLGCPSAAYLAGAGIGRLGIVDGDVVEDSNLHRQILYTTQQLGCSKAESVRSYVNALNPFVHCEAYSEHLTPLNARNILKDYDMILDCTDTPSSRYLISDVAVLLEKPLISASALGTEGQLLVLNYPVGRPGVEAAGPCYRCVFPSPPARETVMSCGEGGILGPVVGLMGLMQALEAIKIVTKGITSADNGAESREPCQASMLVYSAFDSAPFRTIKLRGRRKRCHACSHEATISFASVQNNTAEYAQLCGAEDVVSLLQDYERVTPSELVKQRDGKTNSLLIDLREQAHFDVYHLPGSLNIPYSILNGRQDLTGLLDDKVEGVENVFMLCRLGNDSQLAVRKLKSIGLEEQMQCKIRDVKGGWQAWRREVDGSWPEF